MLEYLGRKVVGQAASNKDQVDIEQAIDEVYVDLQSDKIMTWSTTGDVPTGVVPHVKALAGYRRSSGLSTERYQRVLSDASIAKREIKRIIAPYHEPLDEPTDF